MEYSRNDNASDTTTLSRRALVAKESGSRKHLPLILPGPLPPQISPAQHVIPAPNITVLIPGPLRKYCEGTSELALAAPNVRAMLEELERLHPALHRNVCDETGAVRRHVNLFVNTHHMRDRNGLDTPLVAGDEVTILPAVSGG